MKILLLDIEKYKPIPYHEGYIVDPLGEVISLKWGKQRKLSPWINSNGYLTCKIDNKQYPLHLILMNTFNPKPIDLEIDWTVNHRDGNKLNNSLDNLEWISRQENLYHALRTGLHINPEKPVIGTYILTGEEYWFRSQKQAECETDVKQSNISKCLSGERSNAGGYTWRQA